MAQARLHIKTTLCADHHHGLAAEAGQTANDGLIVMTEAIACQRRVFLKQPLEIVEGARALGMAGHHHLLPGRQLGISCPKLLLRLVGELADFVGDVDAFAVLRHLTKFGNLVFKLGNRLFEIEILTHDPPIARLPSRQQSVASRDRLV